jgi:ApbE superfamily uncharacterized protein (UPF0280 family)
LREPALVRTLPDGKRLHLQDGPIDLILEADGDRPQIAAAYEAALRRFVPILDELCSELPLLRTAVSETSVRPLGCIAQHMCSAVQPYGDDCFVTPMAAVAGAVAEATLEAMLADACLDRAYVNNGGDIALHLSAGNSYTIGMVERPDRPSLFGFFEVSFDDPVRGIATSGWRGRSFSLGIADAVTVLAETAAGADAAATIIANAVDLPGHPAVTRVRAREIAPDSDLGDLLVTRAVAALTDSEIELALAAGAGVAQSLAERALIHSAALNLQGQMRVVSPLSRQIFAGSPTRSLPHA